MSGFEVFSRAGGSGGIGGSTGGTDNAVLRADGAGGGTLQESLAVVTDTGVLRLPAGTHVEFGETIDRIGYISGTGPFSQDDSTGARLTHDVQSLSAHRVVTWPNATGAVPVASAIGTTVGAAGGASALPATPLGYFTIVHPTAGTVKVPYYNT